MKLKNAFLSLATLFIVSATVSACGLFGGAGDDPYSGKLSDEERQMLETVIEQRVESKEKPASEYYKPQDKRKNKWGEDSAQAVREYSIYSEYAKQENWDLAYKSWSWLFKNAPEVNEGLYINGAKIVENKVKTTEDKSLKNAYIDTLYMVYDQRIEYFNNKGYVLGRKAMDALQNRAKDYEDAYAWAKESFELEGENSSSSIPYYLLYAGNLMVKYEKMEVSQYLEDYEKSMAFYDQKIAAGENLSEMKEKANALATPLLSCDELVPAFQKQFEDKKGDIDVLKKQQAMLNKKNCTDAPFYMTLSEQVFQLEPSAEGAYSLGRGYLSKGNTAKAIEFLKKAFELDNSNADFAYYLAVAYNDAGSLASSKTYAKRAISLNPNYGDAYMLLGDIYVKGSGQCGDGFKKQTVYWVAVDQYIKAKQVQPSLASDANKRIATYSAAFPGKQETFFQNLNPGDSYTVECWINESTTVRVSE